MTPIRIVTFNGLGQPTTDALNVKDGDVLLLVQGNDVSVVKLEILPPDQFGPSLNHAVNEPELVADARAAVTAHHPKLLESDDHWTLECPPEIVARAVFSD